MDIYTCSRELVVLGHQVPTHIHPRKMSGDMPVATDTWVNHGCTSKATNASVF